MSGSAKEFRKVLKELNLPAKSIQILGRPSTHGSDRFEYRKPYLKPRGKQLTFIKRHLRNKNEMFTEFVSRIVISRYYKAKKDYAKGDAFVDSLYKAGIGNKIKILKKNLKYL
jgi:hypothetical protein